MAQVLNYHDAVVYDTDVGLFDDGEWLNDNCINWFFRVLEHETFPGRADLLFMDPAVVSCMINQCDDLEEFVDLGRGLELASRSMVFVPVNNAAGPLSRGSHWSLLVFEQGSKGANESNSSRFRHFDSSAGTNRRPAERTAAKFLQMLDGKVVAEVGDSLRVEHVRDAPQQRNAFDCGMYTVLLAEHLAAKTISPATAVDQISQTMPTPPAPAPRKKPRQDRGALPAGKGGAVDLGCGGGAEWEEVKVALGEDGSSEEVTDVAMVAMSPQIVSSARSRAREHLSHCIRSHGCR